MIESDIGGGGQDKILVEVYSKTCLNQTSLRPTFVFWIDRCLVYAGKINKDFLHWDIMQSTVYTRFWFIQGSVYSIDKCHYILCFVLMYNILAGFDIDISVGNLYWLSHIFIYDDVYCM